MDEKTLKNFFDNLESEITDVLPQISGTSTKQRSPTIQGKKVFLKKGNMYPEIIRNVSKTSISIMFCGNAAGELLPPYVVYRKMSTTWTDNGPKGCHYNVSTSGWFDANIFTD